MCFHCIFLAKPLKKSLINYYSKFHQLPSFIIEKIIKLTGYGIFKPVVKIWSMTEHDLRAILSANLKRYRNYRKFTQEEMAEKLEISIPFLSDVENGRKWVSPATLVKLADVLGVEPHDLFKPEQSLSPAMALTLGKWSDEVVQAVTMTVKKIQDYYIAKADK